MNPRFQALTGIRAIAAIMVFLYHNRKHWRSWLPEIALKNFNEFHIGVSLFFVLSGFLIAYTYGDTPMQNKKEYFKYILIRLARIFPVYLLLLAIQNIHFGFPVKQNAFFNYSLLKGLSDLHNLDGIPQSWSLTVEICFYILAPFIYFFTRKNILKTLLYLLLLAGLAILIGYSWHRINGNPNRWLYNWWFVLDGTFFGRSIEFFVGVLLAYFIQVKHPILQKINIKNTTFISGVLCLACIYGISFFEKNIYTHGTESIPGLLLRNTILPIFIAVLIYGLIVENTWFSKLLSTKLFVLLGNASYIFYLIHIGYLNQLLARNFLMPDRNFTILWLIAIFGYLFIEKPIYNFCRQLVKRW